MAGKKQEHKALTFLPTGFRVIGHDGFNIGQVTEDGESWHFCPDTSESMSAEEIHELHMFMDKLDHS